MIVRGYYDGTIRILNETICLIIKKLIGHTHYVWSLEVLPDGSLASGSLNNTIKIWNFKSGLTIKTLTGHTKFKSITRWFISLCFL